MTIKTKQKTPEYIDGAETYERLRKAAIIKMDTEKEAAIEAQAHMPTPIQWAASRAHDFLRGFMDAWKNGNGKNDDSVEEITLEDIDTGDIA